MPKAYWISCYRRVVDPKILSEYALLAEVAIAEGGGKFLARARACRAYEEGILERTVVVEFESIVEATNTYEGEAYSAALRLLEGAVERDFRIVEGV